MATTPTIQYLRLDAQYDPIFDPTANLIDAAAVAQMILTRLSLFLGEWWENLLLGLPVFQAMLGQLGSGQQVTAMDLAVQTIVNGTPFVTSSSNVTVKFADGVFTFKGTANTPFGPVDLGNLPGASAVL